MTYLKSLNLSEYDLHKRSVNPHFRSVTLYQLLTTWVTHNLGHIAQISSKMAKQYKADIGPWSNTAECYSN